MLVTTHTANDYVWVVELKPDSSGQVLIDGNGTQTLLECLRQAEESESCRVLVVKAPHGCQGMDMAFALEAKGGLEKELQSFADLLKAICGSKLAVVAAVDGNISGGGVGLFAAADKVIATEKTTFSLPELVLGILPAMILPVLLRRMPQQKANNMAISPAFKAAEAQALGLVEYIVADNEKAERKLKGTLKHLLRLKPSALAQLKAYTERLGRFELDEAIDLGVDRTGSLLADPQNAEPIRAFLAGEPLPWFAKYRHEEPVQ
jgi:enoyl-CoA hydratase/carnithine racemase